MTQTIEQLQARVAELEEEKREFQLEAQGQIEFLDKNLILAQADNKRLRNALSQTNFWLEGALQCKEWNWEPDQRECAEGCLGYAKESLAQPSDTSALDAYVAEKVKEAKDAADFNFKQYQDLGVELDKVCRQRDLAVDALDCFYQAWAAGRNSVQVTAIEYAKSISTIKASEEK